jgi:hypothetical protein
MCLFILLFCFIVLGLFVYWRVSIARDLVKPDDAATGEQSRQIESYTQNYKKPVEDFSNNAREAYKDVE